MGRPKSTLKTPGALIQISAALWSIGMDVVENNPSNSPHCRLMSAALNVTAKTPGKKR
jgi:hypothetical protein